MSQRCLGNMLQDIHVIGQAHLINIRASRRRFRDIIPTRPRFPQLRHQRQIRVKNRCVFASLEARQDLPFFEVGFWEDESVGLVAVSGYYYVVVEFGFSVLEVQAHAAVIVVGYGSNNSVEEYVVWGETFHYCVDVTLGAVFEGQPVWSGGYGVQEVVIPPIDS